MSRISYTHFIMADQEIYTDILRINKTILDEQKNVVLLGAAWKNPYEELLESLEKFTEKKACILACIHRRYFCSDWDVALECLQKIHEKVANIFPKKVLLYSRLYSYQPMNFPEYCKFISRPDELISEIKKSIRNNNSMQMIPEILLKYEK